MGEYINNADYKPPAQVKPGEAKTIQSAIDDVNSQLAGKGLKLELPKKSLDIAETDEEKQVLELVKKVGLKESFESNVYVNGVKIKKIQDGVFTVISNTTGNVNYFVNNKGEILLSLNSIEEYGVFIKNGKAFEFAGYEFIKDGRKKNLYAVLNTGEKELIDINSRFYYLAWKHIIFTDDLLTITYAQEKRKKPFEKEGEIQSLEAMIENGAVRISNIEKMLERGIITQEIFNRLLEKIKTILVAQCKDIRLIRIGAGIKESDIKYYYEKLYIDSKLALACYKAIPEENRDISVESKK